MRIRMVRWVGGYVEVRDLEPGKVYDISDDRAQQFIDNGMAEPASADESRLEAAALRPASRRG